MEKSVVSRTVMTSPLPVMAGGIDVPWNEPRPVAHVLAPSWMFRKS